MYYTRLHRAKANLASVANEYRGERRKRVCEGSRRRQIDGDKICSYGLLERRQISSPTEIGSNLNIEVNSK